MKQQFEKDGIKVSVEVEDQEPGLEDLALKAMRSSLVRLEDIARTGPREEAVEAARVIHALWFDILRTKYGGF